MIIRNSFSRNLLNEIIRLGLFQSDVIDGGNPRPNTDRAELYTALINELIADASSEGIDTLRNDINDNEPLDDIYCQSRSQSDSFVESVITELHDPCDQLDNGCTCDDCTNQIADLAGWDSVDTTVYDCTPVDLDTHEFEDDCERVDLGIDYESLQYRVEHECHRRGFAPRISEVPRRLWNMWSQQGQNLQQMAELVRAYFEAPTTF